MQFFSSAEKKGVELQPINKIQKNLKIINLKDIKVVNIENKLEKIKASIQQELKTVEDHISQILKENRIASAPKNKYGEVEPKDRNDQILEIYKSLEYDANLYLQKYGDLNQLLKDLFAEYKFGYYTHPSEILSCLTKNHPFKEQKDLTLLKEKEEHCFYLLQLALIKLDSPSINNYALKDLTQAIQKFTESKVKNLATTAQKALATIGQFQKLIPTRERLQKSAKYYQSIQYLLDKAADEHKLSDYKKCLDDGAFRVKSGQYFGPLKVTEYYDGEPWKYELCTCKHCLVFLQTALLEGEDITLQTKDFKGDSFPKLAQELIEKFKFRNLWNPSSDIVTNIRCIIRSYIPSDSIAMFLHLHNKTPENIKIAEHILSNLDSHEYLEKEGNLLDFLNNQLKSITTQGELYLKLIYCINQLKNSPLSSIELNESASIGKTM